MVARRRTHALFETQPPAKQFMTTAANKKLMHFNSPRHHTPRYIVSWPVRNQMPDEKPKENGELTQEYYRFSGKAIRPRQTRLIKDSLSLLGKNR